MTPAEQENMERLAKVGMAVNQLWGWTPMTDSIAWAVTKIRALEEENAKLRQVLK